MSADNEATARRVYSVKEFTFGLSGWFARKRFFSNLAITGEVSGVHPFGNGHIGFVLKEEQAVLECVAWSDRRRDLPPLRDGISVIATGSIGVRPDRGCYQLVVESIEPTGLGALFLQYERLKEKFRAEGLFESERKRPVPELPRRVALISARAGKATEDFLKTIARRAPFVEVQFIETQVQGLGAEIEIATALDGASRLDVDVIVLTRGGGSYEDLFPFNLEPVVRAIVRARHPVLTAIGHSGDHHLADDAADRSFGTPSLAAEHIAQGWVLAARRVREAERALRHVVRGIVLQASRRTDDLRLRLGHAGALLLTRKRTQLSDLQMRLQRLSPQRLIGRQRERLIALAGNIETGRERYFGGLYRRVERTAARLDGLNPLSPLERGYAIVTAGGKAVRDAAALHAGDAIEARFERGRASARVEGVLPDE